MKLKADNGGKEMERYKENEKRRYERRLFAKIIRYTPYHHLGKPTEIACEGFTFDISKRGLSMITDCPLKKGDILFFEPEMRVNDSTAKVATVKWVREIDKDEYKVGLKIYIEAG
jgi:hypothetical protein